MKTNNHANQRGNAHIILINVVFVIVAAAVGYLFFTNVFHVGAPTADSAGVTIPRGWKSYASQKFETSFVIPEKWTVKEGAITTQNRSQTNPRYEVSAFMPGNEDSKANVATDFGFDFNIEIYENTLQAFIDARIKSDKTFFVPGTSLTYSSAKWDGHDAILYFVNPTTATNPTARYHRLFVQYGKYVYEIPYTKDASVHASVVYGKLSGTDWVTISDSVRIGKASLFAPDNN